MGNLQGWEQDPSGHNHYSADLPGSALHRLSRVDTAGGPSQERREGQQPPAQRSHFWRLHIACSGGCYPPSVLIPSCHAAGIPAVLEKSLIVFLPEEALLW